MGWVFELIVAVVADVVLVLYVVVWLVGSDGQGLVRLVAHWMDWDFDGDVACFWRTWREGSVCSCSVRGHHRRAVTYLSMCFTYIEGLKGREDQL